MNTNEIKTKWDLSLFYEDDSSNNEAGDPSEAIQADVASAREAYEGFADTYRADESYLEDPKALKGALEELEYLGGKKNLSRPLYYLAYRRSLNSADQEAEAMENKLSQEYTKLGNLLTFFDLKLGKVSKAKQQEFLASEELAHYRKYLQWFFKTAQYQLDESTENTLSLTSLPRFGMWVDGVQKVLSQKTVEWKGEELPLPEAMNKIQDLITDDRRKLHNLCIEKVKEVKEFSESEINAVVTNKKIVDEMRGYESPYQATVLGYENTPEEVETLVNTVTDNFDVAHDFYDIKAEILDVDKLSYADRQASVGNMDREFDYQRSVELAHEAISGMDADFAAVFERLVTGGQVDVYPKKGKQGGAFCSGAQYLPTLLFLNHVDNYDSLKTFVHEMGHAIHTEMSKERTPLYQEYTTSTAETASTLFEKVFFNYLYPQLTDEEKVIALHDKINGKVSTIFRQVACFNFEKDLHEGIREKGSLPHTEIAKLMNRHMQAYLGDRFELTDDDGYFFISWPHIRNSFYVYSYAYGDLVSSAMMEKLDDDPDYTQEIKQFLLAGSSKSPQEIFADIGIDTTTPEVFETGIQAVRDDIEELRKLI
ncbi:MAG: M3 family metallopeptidase [Candidatus Paceibacterota bacterium]